VEPARSWVEPLWAARPRTEKSRCAEQHYVISNCPESLRHNPPRPGTSVALTASRPLATEKELSDFLKSVEKRAFKRTAYTVRNDDAALDIVQDSMIRLAEKYADRPPQELPLVFQRILSNATMDWFRRQKVRNAVLVNLSEFEGADDSTGDFDLLELLDTSQGSVATESAADSVGRLQILALIETEVARLPTRQREAFLLRYWEEMDVAETASVMGCSEGSVKTHCSRAVHALAKALRTKGISR
jgi:RNA polymerase sigma-70 factor (ECF subfamily)